MNNKLKIITLCSLIFILGLTTRLAGGMGTMMFTYDQARDAFAAKSILLGDWKIVGPTSDIPGLHHGPLFYYLLAPLYGVSGGDPMITMIGMFIVNLLCLIPLGFLAQALFKNKRLTLISMVLFATSYEAISYSRWLSNPPLALLAMGLFYLGLWRIIEKNKLGFIMVGIGMALAIQTEFFLVYLLPIFVLGLVFFCYRNFLGQGSLSSKIGFLINRYSITAAIIFFTIISTYFIAEIKFGFSGWHGLTGFFSSQSSHNVNLVRVDNYIKGWQEVAQRNIALLSPTIALPALSLLGILTLGLFLFRPKDRRAILYLLFLCLSSVPIFVISEHYLPFINIGIIFPLFILVAYTLNELINSFRLSIIPVWFFIVVSLSLALPLTRQGNLVFQVQAEFRLQDELAVVVETYRQANGQPFSLAAVSNPLHIPTTWAYLYGWYAAKNNLTVPAYHADVELSYPGDMVFVKSRKIYPLEFVIIEPEINEYWLKKDLGEEAIRTNLIGQKKFNRIVLQTRIPKNKPASPTVINTEAPETALPR